LLKSFSVGLQSEIIFPSVSLHVQQFEKHLKQNL